MTNVGCKTKSALSLAQGYLFSHTVLTQGQKGEWDTRSTWGISTTSCALALVKLRKLTATGTGFFGFTTRFPFQQSLCSSGRIGTWLGLDIYTSLCLKFSLLLFSGTVHAVTVQLWARWWRWYLLSSADQSPTMRTVFFQHQQLLMFCCLVVLPVT